MKFIDKVFEQQKDQFKESTWINNTQHTARFMLMLDNTNTKTYCGGVRAIKIAPGESIVLQSVYDRAIRTLSETGEVVGGLCPWLEKLEDDYKPELAKCLDFESVIEEEAAKKLAEKLQKDTAMAEARKVLAAKKLEAEEANKEPQVRKSRKTAE